MMLSRARMLWAEGSSNFSSVYTYSKLFSLPVSLCIGAMNLILTCPALTERVWASHTLTLCYSSMLTMGMLGTACVLGTRLDVLLH